MLQEPTNKDILDVLQSFAGSVDSRFEKIESRMATKEDLKNSEEKVINEMDGFITLHQTLDVELASLRSRCERMEGFMVRVGDKLDMKYQPT